MHRSARPSSTPSIRLPQGAIDSLTTEDDLSDSANQINPCNYATARRAYRQRARTWLATNSSSAVNQSDLGNWCHPAWIIWVQPFKRGDYGFEYGLRGCGSEIDGCRRI